MAKILLVEDDFNYGAAIKKWLESQLHTVEFISSGRLALEYLKTYQYELVILDWVLPEVDGLEVCRRFRDDGGASPILMLTGKTQKSDTASGLNSGADDYLTKPAHPEEFMARVNALLRRPRQLLTTKISIKHVTLDVASRKVMIDGKEVEILPREYILLEYLMKHPNRVFTPEELVNALWTAEVTSPADVVRTTVKRLRRKIDLPDKPSLIRNVYSLGYSIDNP